jgi:hypothetical protein
MMAGNVLDMGKKKPDAKKRPPSRDKVKYVQIPKEYWDLLNGLSQDGEKYEGRSVAFLAKLAVRAMLQTEGLVDDKGKPKPGGKRPE